MDRTSSDADIRHRLASLEAEVAQLKAHNRLLGHYRDLSARSNDHILMIDADAVCQAANRTYLLANNLAREDICGHPVRSLMGYPFFDPSMTGNLRLCLEGQPVYFNHWYVYPVLGRRYMEVTYYPHADASGNADGVILVGRDLTEILEHQRYTSARPTRTEAISASLMQLPVGILVVEVPEATLLWMNPEAERILGFTHRELGDAPLLDRYDIVDEGWSCLHADGTPLRKEELPLYRFMTTGAITRNLEMTLRRRDGGTSPVMSHLAPVYDNDRNPVEAILLLTDISAFPREGGWAALTGDNEDAALTAPEEGLWDWDLTTWDGTCNRGYYTMLGYEWGEFPGNSAAWEALLHPEDREKTLQNVSRVIAENRRDYESVYRMRCKNGEYRWILSRGMVMFDEETGRPARIIGTHKDISQWNRTDRELQQSHDALEEEVQKRTRELLEANRQLESIFNLSSESIWVCDGRGIVLKVNHATERLLEANADEIVGYSIMELMAKGFMDRSATLEVLATKRQVSMLQYVPRNNRQLLVTGTPIFNQEGEVSLVTAVERDLTELNQLHEELERNLQLSSRYQQELNEWNILEVQKQRVVAESAKMRNVLRTAIKLASQNVSNILILGESGTGKGMLARLIHENSSRRKGPFIEINCAALPETLLEAELFGYEKGAFTGALEQGKAGLFELAQNGTLFLDEIGDLPMPLQAKLLKYLDNYTIMHLGGLKPIPIDCTIIAATNLDLGALVGQKKFRKDLFYRLNTFTINIPPLRERREDVFELTRHFLDSYNEQFNARKQLSPRAINAFQTYPFPGNVRELRSLIKVAVVLSEGTTVDSVLFEAMGRNHLENPFSRTAPEQEFSGLDEQMDRYERLLLEQAILRCRSTRQLAQYLRTSQSRVVRKLRKHGLGTEMSH